MKFRQIAITIMSGLLVIQPFSATAGFFDLPGYPAAYPESAIVSPSTVEVGGTVTLKIRVVAGDRDLNSNLDAYAITSTARKIYLGPIATRISGTIGRSFKIGRPFGSYVLPFLRRSFGKEFHG